MCWALRFGFEWVWVVSIDTFQVCLKSLPNFHDKNLVAFHLIFMAEFWQHFALFLWWKSDSVSPYFRGRNSTALHLRCVIARQTLFSPYFRCENMAMRIPHFYGENSTRFRILCTMAHWKGFASLYTTCINMLSPWQAKALQNFKHVDACWIHGETTVTWWNGSRQSHHDDRAHNIAWICTYGNCLEDISILQDQELSWLERVTHVQYIHLFFWNRPLARIYCGLPLKVHEVLIILGLGIQQRGPRFRKFMLAL